jgi:hypothetical protein
MQQFTVSLLILITIQLITIQNISGIDYVNHSLVCGLICLNHSLKTIENSTILDFASSKLLLEIPVSSSGSTIQHSRKELLIVLHTRKGINSTILALDYLKGTFSDADLIVIDDFSNDGTTDYLFKKGYTLISKDREEGLVDSWNKGYEFANAMKYKYVIFTTNEALLTALAVKVLKEDLKNEAFVSPLSTTKGAGLNPSQVC